jgi:hypothetical protein
MVKAYVSASCLTVVPFPKAASKTVGSTKLSATRLSPKKTIPGEGFMSILSLKAEVAGRLGDWLQAASINKLLATKAML